MVDDSEGVKIRYSLRPMT